MSMLSACQFLGVHTIQAKTLRSDCVKILKHATLPKPNITREEKKALHNLVTDNTITILTADKGSAVVVIKSVDYKQKANKILSDTKTYNVLAKEPMAKYTTTLVKNYKNSNKLTPLPNLTTSTCTLPHRTSHDSMASPRSTRQGPLSVPEEQYRLGSSARRLPTGWDRRAGLVRCDRPVHLCAVDQSMDMIFDKLSQDPTLPTRTAMTGAQGRDLLTICIKTT